MVDRAMYRTAIVDDNEAWLFTLENFLQQQGFAVTTFSDAHSFMKVADQFDIALVDFSMPSPHYQKEVNGPELISQLKQSLTRAPFLILVSAYFTDEILEYAKELCPHADAYLSKGIGLKGIVQRMQQLLTDKFGTRFYYKINALSNGQS
jgi:CheY-like chemotaxis protein